MKYIFCSIALGIALMLCTLAWGHEPDGYKHLVKDEFIGPHIMSARFCPGSSEYMMWIVDRDGDNIADECNQVVGGHQTVHFKRWEAINGQCGCEVE